MNTVHTKMIIIIRLLQSHTTKNNLSFNELQFHNDIQLIGGKRLLQLPTSDLTSVKCELI